MLRPQKKSKLTWAALRQQRSALKRFEIYLPTLQLKQQLLQSAVLQTLQKHAAVQKAVDVGMEKISTYQAVFSDTAGVDLATLSKPADIAIDTVTIAGVRVPVFQSATFPQAAYSLFGTPAWIDQALTDQREQNTRLAELDIIEQKLELLQNALRKVTQRVNLFEKVIMPEARDNIRRIRIALGDRMTAAVARAKIAKEKLQQRQRMKEPEVEST